MSEMTPYPTTYEEMRRAWEASQRMLAVAIRAAGGILVISKHLLADPPRQLESSDGVDGTIILRVMR